MMAGILEELRDWGRGMGRGHARIFLRLADRLEEESSRAALLEARSEALIIAANAIDKRLRAAELKITELEAREVP